jgi:hypothetical protein
MDYGRRLDLEQLHIASQKANTPLEKRIIENAVRNIKCQDQYETQMREYLTKAVRGSDTYSIKKYSELLNTHKQLKLNGRQF